MPEVIPKVFLDLRAPGSPGEAPPRPHRDTLCCSSSSSSSSLDAFTAAGASAALKRVQAFLILLQFGTVLERAHKLLHREGLWNSGFPVV